MRYLRAQFRDKIVFTKVPWVTLGEAEAEGQPNVAEGQGFVIEDDGPLHIRVTRKDATVRVHWSNVPGAVPAPAIDPLRMAGVPVALTPLTMEEAISAAPLLRTSDPVINESMPNREMSASEILAPLFPTTKGKGPRRGGAIR